MVTRLRRTRHANVEMAEPITDDVEDVEDDEATDVLDVLSGNTEKATLDRIEQRYRDRADSPLRAIRAFCVLCMGCQPRMVTNCTATKCVLHPFRFGKNPYQKHTKKTSKLKSIATENNDGSTDTATDGTENTLRKKRRVRSSSS